MTLQIDGFAPSHTNDFLNKNQYSFTNNVHYIIINVRSSKLISGFRYGDMANTIIDGIGVTYVYCRKIARRSIIIVPANSVLEAYIFFEGDTENDPYYGEIDMYVTITISENARDVESARQLIGYKANPDALYDTLTKTVTALVAVMSQ